MSILEFLPSVFHVILILSFSSMASYYFKIDRLLSPFIIYTSIINILFFSSINGLLKESVFLLYILGAILFFLSGYLFFYKIQFKEFLHKFLYENLPFFILVLLSPILFSGQIVGMGDEYNYWAIAVKEMLATNVLPGAGSGLFYKSYHPGLTLLHYFNLFPYGYLETWLYGSYLALNLSALNVLRIRFRQRYFIGLIAYVAIAFIGYKLLGVGIKSLIADQFLSFGYLACLVLLLAHFNKVRHIIIIPMLALIQVKQPGIVITYFVYAIWFLNELKYCLRHKHNKKKLLSSVLLIFVFFISIKEASRSWVNWADAHGANGLFLTGMNSEGTSDYIKRIFDQGPNPKESRLINDFFSEFLSLPFGMPLEINKVNEKWPLWSWLLIWLALILFSTIPARRFYVSVNKLVFPILSLVFWTFGLLILYIKFFSQVHEGPFPSMDRYFSIVFSPLFLLTSYYVGLSYIYRKNTTAKIISLVVIIFTIIFAPNSGGGILSKRELEQGRDEIDFFKPISSEIKNVAELSSLVCILYQGPYKFNQRVIYDLSPARSEIIGITSDLKISDVLENKQKCTHILSFCHGPEECKSANIKLPSLFNSKAESQVYLIKWDDFLKITQMK